MNGREIAILAIGDELLAGAHPDLDTPLVARELAQRGFAVVRAATERDTVDAIEQRLRELLRGCALVVTTGGLGPTDDDVTRDAVARVGGVDLVEDQAVWNAIRARFAARGTPAPESNRRQALIPRGARILANAHGTAPGFWVDLADGRAIASLPGPPRECAGVLADSLVPLLDERFGGAHVERAHFALVGLAESEFADRLGGWMARDAVPRMGVSAREGTLAVHFVAPADEHAALVRRCAEFRERFGPWIFAEADVPLERVVIDAARARGATVAIAESCTGGLVAARLTSIPGASAVVREGFVVYHADAKRRALEVPDEVLAAHGEVSPATAAAMARGARAKSGADFAVAVTGIAGPGGGSDEKPVGLVCFAVESRAGEERVTCRFPGDRDRIRAFATQVALDLLRRALLGIDSATVGWRHPSAPARRESAGGAP